MCTREGGLRSELSAIEHAEIGGNGWAVLAYYLNQQMVDVTRPERPFGIVVPCGSYNTENEARNACNYISAMSGAPCVVVCRERKPFPLRLTPDENILQYPRQVGADVQQIELAIREERKRRKDVEERLQVERVEREDSNSLSYCINTIYHAASHSTLENELNDRLKILRMEKQQLLDKLRLHLQYNPENLHIWKAEAKLRLSERGEHGLYEVMEREFDKLLQEMNFERERGTAETGTANYTAN